MHNNTTPEGFRIVKNDRKNDTKQKNRDHFIERKYMEKNPSRQMDSQKQQGWKEIGWPEMPFLLELLQNKAAKRNLFNEADQERSAQKAIPRYILHAKMG